MTTLIMVQKDSDVELGWDSQLTRSNEKHSLTAPKIFVNGGLILGVTGVSRASDILETTEFPTYDPTLSPRHWLIKVFTPILQEALAAQPYLMTDEGLLEGWGFAVVVEGQVFQFDSMYNPAQQADGLYTMGSGGDYARGALCAGASVAQALEVAASIDPYTGGTLTTCLASTYLAANGEHASVVQDGRLKVH